MRRPRIVQDLHFFFKITPIRQSSYIAAIETLRSAYHLKTIRLHP